VSKMKMVAKQIGKGRKKRWWRFPVYVSLGVMCLVLLALAVTQTGWFKTKVREAIENAVSEKLNASFTIEKLHGSLFTSLQLDNMVLFREADTILHIDQLRAVYSFWPLLSRKVLLDSVALRNPMLRLRQFENGEWNVANLFVEDTKAAPTSAQESGLPFDMTVGHAGLTGGAVIINSNIKQLPKEIRDITFSASATLYDSLRTLTVEQFSLAAHQPDFTLRQLSFHAEQNDSGITVSNLELRTARNDFSVFARYQPPRDEATTADIKNDSLTLSEFSFLLPQFHLGVVPRFVLNANLRKDTLRFAASLTAREQRLAADAVLAGISLRKDTTGTINPNYSVTVEANRLELDRWLADPSLRTTLNGTLQLTGDGFTAESAHVSGTGYFSGSSLAGHSLDSLHFTVGYDKGAGELHAQIASPVGKATIDGSATSLLSEPAYDFNAALRHVDLGQAFSDTTLASDISGKMSMRGRGIDPDRLRADVVLELAGSSMSQYSVDTLFASMNIRDREVRVDTFLVRTADLDFSGQGEYSLADSSLAAQTDIRLRSAEILRPYVPVEQLEAEGEGSISVAGRIDSLSGTMEAVLKNLRADDFAADTLHGTADFAVASSQKIIVSSDLHLLKLSRSGTELGKIDATVDMSGDSISVDATLSSGDTLRVATKSDIVLNSVLAITLHSTDITFRTQAWTQTGSEAKLLIDSTGFSLDRFELESEAPKDGVRSRLLVSGRFATQGNHDLHVTLDNLDLSAAAHLVDSTLALDGSLTARADLGGSVEDPELHARIAAVKGSAYGIAYDSVSGRFDYASDSMSVNTRVSFVEYPPLTISGYLPIRLFAGNDSSYIVADRQFSIQLACDSLPLGLARPFVRQRIDELSGYASFTVDIGNTINEPHFAGQARILDGKLRMSRYGIDYRNINAFLSLDSNRINLDSLSVSREKGTVTASGYAVWSPGETTGEITATALELHANNFFVSRQRHYEFQITGNARFSTEDDQARFGGEVTVLRSSIYLPAFTGEVPSEATSSGEVPMLVEATRPEVPVDSTSNQSTPGKKKEALNTSDLYKNLRGKFTLMLPRNTWVTSPEMRMELKGSLDIVKEGPEPQLFGGISVVRGFYELYGRRFVVQEGDITFEGGTEINPRLVISAKYVFRDPDRQQRTLVLHIEGKAKSPRLRFELDGAEISDGDAMAYILFGRNLSELTFGQRGTVAKTSGENGNLAQRIATGFLASQLEKTLGRGLELDVFEIQAQEDWSGAAFEVGKYLTTDLFVSYRSGFGTARDNEVVPQEVTLEYELTRYLFLRLIGSDTRTSGFDLILRLQED
jgi:translocation and assembly module TamB